MTTKRLLVGLGAVAVCVTAYILSSRDSRSSPSEILPKQGSIVGPESRASRETVDLSSLEDVSGEETADILNSLSQVEPRDYNEGLEDHTYREISADSLYSVLESIPRLGEEQVSPDQTESLLRTLEENLWAYKVGSAPLIRASLFAAPYTLSSDIEEQLRSLFRTQTRVNPDDLPNEMNEQLEVLSEKFNFGENGSGFTNLYNKVSPEGSTISFRTRNSMPKPIRDEITEIGKLGGPRAYKITSQKSFLTYENSPERVLERDGKILYADIRLAATDASDELYYRIKRYYWSGKNDLWLPMDFAIVDKPTRSGGMEFF